MQLQMHLSMPIGGEINIHTERRASASKINVRSGRDAEADKPIETEELAHGTLAIFLTGKIYGCLNHDLLRRQAGGSISHSMTSSFAAVTQNDDNNDTSHHNHSLVGQIVIIHHHQHH